MKNCQTVREMAEELFENLGSDNLSAYIYKNDEEEEQYIDYRETGNFGEAEFEQYVLGEINLEMAMWRDTLAEWEMVDDDDDNIIDDVDYKDDFVVDVLVPQIKRILG